jgi:hypothetical protein
MRGIRGKGRKGRQPELIPLTGPFLRLDKTKVSFVAGRKDDGASGVLRRSKNR